MIVNKITKDQLLAAAAAVGVVVVVDSINAKGTRHRVKVNPLVTAELYTAKGYRLKGDKGDAKYQRESVGYGTAGRRVHAVCWHGFKFFFRACFELAPTAIFYTSVDTWKGSADFEARFAASGHRNIGPRIAPTMMADACRCPDRGYAG